MTVPPTIYPAPIQQTKIKDRLYSHLENLRPLLRAFIESDKPFDFWTPDPVLETDPCTVAHIKSLEIPAVGTRPGILIDRLGRFAEDDKLRARVDGISKRTRRREFLVNSSATGKTRLSPEGLCRHWGFYFTMALDCNALGSADSGPGVHDTISRTTGFKNALPPRDSIQFYTTLRRNIQVVDESFAPVLLGRLLAFILYSEIIQSLGIVEEHKRRWLLFQLRPRLKGDLSPDILGEFIIYTYMLANDEVEDLIAVMFSKLRKIYGPAFHLFFVIDEAQCVSRKHTEAFQHEGKPYPILREIIRALAARSPPQELAFVIVGTDIPKDGFENAPFAASIRWCSDTGAFDDEADHRVYVSRFLTPSYAASPAGEMFLQRMWTWCRGRHRLTDAVIKALLMDGFRAPHKLLNDYVQTTTTFRPTDYVDDEPFRYPIHVDVSELKSYFFSGSPLLKSTIHQALFHYLAVDQPPSPFSQDLTPLVSAGFGRFTDKEMSQVVMDEPIFLIRAALWLCEPPPREHNTYSRGVLTPQRHSCFDVLTYRQTSLDSRSFSAFLPFYLARAFDNGSKLSKVFAFSDTPIPKWANQTAELVVFTGETFTTFSESSASTSLASSASALNEVESWLDGSEGAWTPFCLSHTPDPDLLFVLRLADGKFVRVILRSVVTDAALEKVALENITSLLEPDALLREEGNNAESSDHTKVVAKVLDTTKLEGPSHILRVIASFPGKTDLKTLPPHSTTSPVATLNSALFQKITAKIPAADLLERIVTAVTVGRRTPEPLDLLEAPPRKKARMEREVPQSSRTLRPRKGKQRAA
ncbi:hypothetical protein DFH06DRAFT_1115694 [Mycena polygramma]|nr:hypothetical protein DFH06DRAFT_1115694 [Mycena polygramma]